MAAKTLFLVVAVALVAIGATSAGVVPVAAPLAAAAYITPYASSYHAHVVNHAVAAPYLAAPAVAAPFVSAASPYVAAPYISPYTGLPAPIIAGK